MRHFYLCLVACLCCCTIANERTLNNAANIVNEITVVTVERPPYTSDERDRQGFLTDIVESAFAASGIKVKRYNLPWARAKMQVLSGEADIIYPASYGDTVDINAERIMLYDTLPIVLVKHKETKERWNGQLSSIAGSSVASLRGVHISPEFNVSKYFKRIDVETTDQLFGLVQKQRVDYAITDELTANYMLSKPAFRKLTILSPPHILSSELYLGVSSVNEDSANIKNAFVAGLESLKRSGEYQNALKQYRINENIVLLADKTNSTSMLESARLIGIKGSGMQVEQPKARLPETKITVIGFDWETDSYQKTYRDTLLSLSKEKGIELNLLDAEGSIEHQINLMTLAAEQKPDVIALWPVHGEKIEPALKLAYDRHIPVVIINTPVVEKLWRYVRSYIGPDNYEEGRLAAQMMAKALNGKGKVIEIQGFPGYRTAALRSLGFYHYLQEQKQQDSNFDIEIVDIASGYWSRDRAYEAMQRLLHRHSHFDGLYVADDNMAVGALKAVQEHGTEHTFQITSATLFGEGYDAIQQGKIWGSVWQSPEEEAEVALANLIQFVSGRDIPLLNFIPIKPVTKSNISEFTRPKF